MSTRSVRLAYVVPPLLAFFLGFIGSLNLSEAGLVGVRSVVTAASGTGSTSNRVVASSMERVARAHDATIARVVADRSAPTDRRVALVTGAPSSDGAAWLRNGYREFSRSMTTRVLPMSALDRYDTTGRYDVIGDERARQATVAALTSAGFEVTSERIAPLAVLGIVDGLRGSVALIGALVLGSVTLCLAGTIGAPRRTAIRRLHGHGTAAVLRDELGEIRTAILVVAVGAAASAVLLPLYNGLAAWPTFAVSVAVLSVVFLVPVVMAHTLGTVMACRRPLPATIRGKRPNGSMLFLSQVARVPAIMLLIAAAFDLTGAIATARSGNADRDIKAAGEAVQLWVTPDAGSAVQSQEFWTPIEAMTRSALERHDALLSAAVEVSTGSGERTAPALFVDVGYLSERDVRAADGTRITAGPDIAVWTSPDADLSRSRLLRSLTGWELRGASAQARAHIGGGELGPRQIYTYPGDPSSEPWLSDVVLVVVPEPTQVFTDDQLGAWLSTGDIVFSSASTADRAVRDANLGDEISAVVAVGQAAAERARHAGIAVSTSIATVLSSALVAVVLALLGTAAHRRRNGRRLFADMAAGRSLARANATLLLLESTLFSVATVVVVNTWWDLRPDGSGRNSVLDPVARSADIGGMVAAIAVLVMTAASITAIVRSADPVMRNRGNGS
ncbi:hypothetical protein [Curtobacterium sp. RRHDQ10]|uniref:hypothetical protein n=1 Tax=Curtobacterium phyllosphaerae TaxID=3413379 RepID=UPI003BF22081